MTLRLELSKGITDQEIPEYLRKIPAISLKKK
jgi:hypothetical protein